MNAQVVYVARHGRTPLNAEGRLRGHEDPALDEVGLGQAEALGRHFASAALAWVTSSPLRRARQTAAAIAAPHGLVPDVDAAFEDRDYGRWAGTPTAEVVARYGSVDAAPGVEPWDAFRARTLEAFLALVADEGAGTGVVVGHDAVNRAIFEGLFGMDPHTTPQRTGCWNELRREGAGWSAVLIDQLPAPSAG